MTEHSDVPANAVVALASGTVAVAVDGLAAASRLVLRLPIVGPLLRRGADELTTIVVQIVEHVVAELDLTALVRDSVDIDAIVADIDIDAIVGRIDLVGLANTVIDGVDLPAIIRESTNSVTADVMTDVRSQGERADDVVAGIVDRVLRRSRSRDDAE